jgi:hypothetical protein
MKKKIIIATTLTLVITFALFANTALGIRISPQEKPSQERLTKITTFDEGCNGWKLFSISFDASLSINDIRVTRGRVVMTLQDAIDTGIINKYIFTWNNEQQRYEIASNFETSKTYLCYVTISDDITLSAVGTFEDSDEPIELFQGWNFIGITTQITLPLSNLRFSCESEGISDLTLEEASDVLISSYIFYATNTNEPMYDVFSGDILVPGDVYLIYALVDGVMMSYVPTL